MTQQWLRGNTLLDSTFMKLYTPSWTSIGRGVRSELKEGGGAWLYRSMTGSFRGWWSEIENRKNLRGTTKKSWTKTWRGNSLTQENGRAKSCPMLSHVVSWDIQEFSHCYQGRKAPPSLSTCEHLKQVWHRNKINSTVYNNSSLKTVKCKAMPTSERRHKEHTQ